MELSDVREVIETMRIQEANSLLKLGWILIAVAPGQFEDTQGSYVRYCLGWTKDLPSDRGERY
ncbi:hypothetical protein [Hahella ganghwensis]|uniref:hypothetical protein n=1 Tax=Hahella ganghwensis TaxID=286420 RepID=UPI0003776012|nr:hypothetical protein [Hahella ganghwensis]